MSIAGLDIASTTGITIFREGVWRASSFHAREKRPKDLKVGAIDYAYEGRVFHAFEDHLRSILTAEKVTDVGIEKPLQSNVTFKRPIINQQAAFAGQAIVYEEAGGTTMATIFRIYPLVGHALSLCSRLNIAVHMISQAAWRTSFGVPTKAPRGTSNSSAWLKAKARERCDELQIVVSNNDQADSAGVCWALAIELGLIVPYGRGQLPIVGGASPRPGLTA